MPQIKPKQPLKKVILPGSSTPEEEAYVMMDIDPRGGDMLEALGQGNLKEANELETGLRIMCILIKEWNFTDDGKPWPITIENLKQLPAGDITEIMQHLNSLQGLSTPKKKS